MCVCLGSKPVTRLLPSVSLRLASEAILDVLSDALGQEDARRNSFWEATCSLAILHPGRWCRLYWPTYEAASQPFHRSCYLAEAFTTS